MRTDALLECVPNISEGRDRKIIDAIARAADEAGGGAPVLDIHSDPDHNRSVFTCVGGADELVQSIMAMALESIRWLDLRKHDGVHPRLGVFDVVPFVPLGRSTMRDAVAAAMLFAETLCGAGVPVFVYEAASGMPLPRIRKDAFESLSPYCGPSKPHPSAGATVVGARDLLVAFNINFSSKDLSMADAIARDIREQEGGLMHVRAIAVPLGRREAVQVSCNLVRPLETTMSDVLDAVEERSSRLGLDVMESELVGLTPAGAIGHRGPDGLKLTSPPRLLEEALAAAGF